MMMLMTIAACSFATVVLFIIGLTMQSEREIMVEMMESHSRGVQNISSDFIDLQTPVKTRILLPILRFLSSLGGKLTPRIALQTIEQDLETAGHPWGLGVREYLGLRVVPLILGIVFGFLLVHMLAGGLSPFLQIVLFCLLGFMGFILPSAMLSGTISSRQATIRKTLPDTLDLLTVSVEAGLGLDGAIQRVVEKLRGPLSEELQRALQEMRVGKRRGDALRDMAARVKVQELSSFVAAVCQAEQLGVSISRVLKVQSETLRTSRAIKAREAATKLPVKMLFPLVFCIFPSLFVVVLAPGAIQIGRAFGLLQH